MEAKKFKNWTNESFSWKYNGIEHTFPAGMEIYMEAEKADHFAKHLVDRELNKLNLPTDHTRKVELFNNCFPSDEVISEEQAMNINEEVKAKAKRGRPAKVKKEEEFADLKTKNK
jgi:intergrase/recombinase